MTPDLEAIRARREHLRLSLVRTSERFEQGAYELRHNAITDIDTLLAEVERLRHELTLDDNFRDPEFGGCTPSR